MEEALYQHHSTVSCLIDEFNDRCQEHFVWLEEVLQVAAENYQKRDVEVLPKTPSVKKKTRSRRKPPIMLSSEDEDFVDSRPSKPKRGKNAAASDERILEEDDNGPLSAVSASSVEATDEESLASGRCSRSTRSTRSNTSSKSNRPTRSNRGKKKVAIKEEEEESSSLQQLDAMESTELEAEKVIPEECSFRNPVANLFNIQEEIEEVEATSSTPVSIFKPDCQKEIPIEEKIVAVQSPAITAAQSLPGSIRKKTPVNRPMPILNSPLQRLKKTLTPVSPKVRLEQLPKSSKLSTEKSSDSADDECDGDPNGSFAGLNVKDKARAYDILVTKLASPALNRTINSPMISTPQTPNTVYKSSLNVTLSGERVPAKARVIRQITNSPQTKRLSQTRRKSSLSDRRSSNTRKSDRIRQQASRMSLAKRKSFLMKNRTSIVEEPQLAAEEAVFTSPPKVGTPMTDTDAEVNTPKPMDSTPEQSTPKRPKNGNRSTPVTRNTCRKRQLTTDSDSSQGTPRNANKRVKPDKVAQSPRVKHLKHEEKSSDSEYVTDDSDVPPSPLGKKGNYRTPKKNSTLVAQKSTPRSIPSPGFSGSFIKRNTPKLTIKERQEQYKKELVQKKQIEDRRLEKIRIQKQQEVERQRRKREERHQQVQAKRMAQERAQTEQSLTTQKSKDRRGSAILREQREKAELERQKRIKKQAEAEERRRQEEEKRLQKIREKEEEAKMIQAMMQRKKEYEEQERQKRVLEEKQLALEKKIAEEKRVAEEKKREQEAELKRQREEAERVKSKQNTSLNSSLNDSLSETVKRELQTYNIHDIKSDDDTDDEDAPKKEIPPWATGARMKGALIHQHYKKPNIEEIFPPIVLLRNPDLTCIFPHKVRPRFDKRTSSAIWSPIQKHFISPAGKSFVKKIAT